MTAITTCLGCEAIGMWGRAGRCPACYRAVDRARQQRRGNRYGRDHARRRRQWAPIVAAGGVKCARCDRPIVGEQWHLDHQGDGTSRPSHPECNSRHTSSTRYGS